MKSILLPKSVPGKWASIMIILFIVLMTAKFMFPFAIPSMIIAALGLIGFAAAIAALIKKDWTILVFIALLLGIVLLWWIGAEVLYPH